MPYRIEAPDLDGRALDTLVALGAIDADVMPGGAIAALMPDAVSPARVASALGVASVAVSPAAGRDGDSVWVLGPRATRIGRLRVVPAGSHADEATVRLTDGPAFGTGLHPTTALCLQALQEAVEAIHPAAVLDVGTGSGVLAIAALVLGIPGAVGVDIDQRALMVAAENARLNGLDQRLRLVCGGPEAVAGRWPLVLANVLAAPLIEMAPLLVRRLGHRARLVLSGIGVSVEDDVTRAYVRLGMKSLRVMSRDGWVALVFEASW